MQIFAHRGYSSIYPENTMLSFRKALEAGADGIELDARLTYDEKIIIMHDSSVDRTTNGSGIVRDMTYAEIRALDAGGKKGIAFENEKVPSLEEVLSEIGGRLLLNIELVNYEESNERTLAYSVGEMVKKHNLCESVIISSFRFNNLVFMKEQHPEIQCGLLTFRSLKGFWGRNILSHSLSVDALHPWYKDVTPALITREHQCGRKVRAWTVNETSDMVRLFHLGVDALYVDDPVTGREIAVSEALLLDK